MQTCNLKLSINLSMYVRSQNQFFALICLLQFSFSFCMQAKLICNISGYCLPDPYNAPRLREVMEHFMQSLRDPSLPLLELQEVIASISGRIPLSVEKKIRKLMTQYERNITSVLAMFPSQQIASVIDRYIIID